MQDTAMYTTNQQINTVHENHCANITVKILPKYINRN